MVIKPSVWACDDASDLHYTSHDKRRAGSDSGIGLVLLPKHVMIRVRTRQVVYGCMIVSSL